MVVTLIRIINGGNTSLFEADSGQFAAFINAAYLGAYQIVEIGPLGADDSEEMRRAKGEIVLAACRTPTRKEILLFQKVLSLLRVDVAHMWSIAVQIS